MINNTYDYYNKYTISITYELVHKHYKIRCVNVIQLIC